ncbi:MAG: CCA tRNA nucleotidyltransferase [Phycisphaeraceae bacterium]|nr:CCA tRNA nucleotidyltransferase [Phycisphaeraceae bacterium]
MRAAKRPWTSEQARLAAVGIVRALREAGHEAYLAGGCVRDELLGLEPTDYDVATDAHPDRIRSLFRRTNEVGVSFGVVLVKERNVAVEVATFRADGPYSDRRRPDHVEFADATADARRRDFTINALFLDPFAEGEATRVRGRVIDLVGGVADLERKVIRAVGDAEQRLAEDHLRALRAVRFASRLGFEIEAGTARAIREHAAALGGVSRERIGDEIRSMMDRPTRARAVLLLQSLSLDAPALDALHCDAEPSVLARLGPEAGLAACLGAWAIDRGEIASEAQLPALLRSRRRALCLSNEERDALRDVLGGALGLPGRWPGLGVAARKRLASSGHFAETLALLRAFRPEFGAEVARCVQELAATPSGLSPAPMITGDDLAAAGLRPGPMFATLLSAVFDAQLEDRIRTREEALALALELAAGPGV